MSAGIWGTRRWIAPPPSGTSPAHRTHRLHPPGHRPGTASKNSRVRRPARRNRARSIRLQRWPTRAPHGSRSPAAPSDIRKSVPPPATADPEMEDWSLAEDLQPSPGRMLETSTWNDLNTDTWTMNVNLNDEPFSFLQHDNEAFLMELTGLDVLGISGS